MEGIEIVAGALQDHRRAIVLGTKSFGKGSVQSVLPMGQSGGVRLTTARYYTPSGRSIQALGVTPDVFLEFKRVEESEEDKRKTFSEADLDGALSNDRLTEAEKDMLRKEEISFQETNKRRKKDLHITVIVVNSIKELIPYHKHLKLMRMVHF